MGYLYEILLNITKPIIGNLLMLYNYKKIIFILALSVNGLGIYAQQNHDMDLVDAVDNADAQKAIVAIENGAQVARMMPLIAGLRSDPMMGRSMIYDMVLERVPQVHTLVDEIGQSPLHLAVANHNKVLAHKLVERRSSAELDAIINAQDGNGWTPLMHAVVARNEDLVKFVLSYNPDPTLTDTLDRTPLQVAQEMGADTIVALLTQYQPHNSPRVVHHAQRLPMPAPAPVTDMSSAPMQPLEYDSDNDVYYRRLDNSDSGNNLQDDIEQVVHEAAQSAEPAIGFNDVVDPMDTINLNDGSNNGSVASADNSYANSDRSNSEENNNIAVAPAPPHSASSRIFMPQDVPLSDASYLGQGNYNNAGDESDTDEDQGLKNNRIFKGPQQTHVPLRSIHNTRVAKTWLSDLQPYKKYILATAIIGVAAGIVYKLKYKKADQA